MGDKISVTVIATGFDNTQGVKSFEEAPVIEEKEPEPEINDPNVVRTSELNSILNPGAKPADSNPFSFEANPDTEEKEEAEPEKEKNTAWGGNLLEEEANNSDDVPLQRRPLNRPNGFADPNDLSQPAIWTEKYGRGIKLTD